jgi:hypothetical protein
VVTIQLVDLIAPHLGRRDHALLDETGNRSADANLGASGGLSRYLTNR